MGSTHSFIARREYVNGVPYWRHFMDGGSVVTTMQGDTMTQGYGALGGESGSAGATALNVAIRYWDAISVKEPNGAYFVPGYNFNRPHAPDCTIALGAPANSLEVTGRC